MNVMLSLFLYLGCQLLLALGACQKVSQAEPVNKEKMNETVYV